MNSQRLRQIAQGLHGSAPFRALELKLEVDTCPIPKLEAVSKESHHGNKLNSPFKGRLHVPQ